ncbi:carboxypeptidase regulatory-like domain-containing protein [Luteimonas sp. MJ174]|uniref:carboxypeptidase regulatory-like domain-containing protein n=1 Tax=Luteimonas sp. MJ174 TaxID=3129237 RepID=UPI0031BAE114
MSLATTIALVLAVAAVAGSLRRILRWHRLPAGRRPGAGRLAAMLLLQCACAALLYATLLPPGRPVGPASLVLMTAGTDAAQARQAVRDGALLVALPEAGSDAVHAAAAQRVPDLATALRLHPQVGHLHVLGSGLATRDREATRGLPLIFDPQQLPPGLVELRAPARVASGGVLQVSGRVQEAAEGAVELLDPAGTVRDRATPDDAGRFKLQAPVRASGPAIYRLRLPGKVEAEAEIPVDPRPGDGARLLLLSGAPNPELKYLRRWASDAGLSLHSHMSLGRGVATGDAPPTFDPESLSQFDLVIVDERAWNRLGAPARRAVLAAVEQGLGLMLRLTAAPDAATRDALRQLGFTLGRADPTLDADVLLDAGKASGATASTTAAAGRAAPVPVDDATDEAPPPLARQPYPILADGSLSLLDDASGTSLSRWRPSGLGRIAIWNLDQSFRLVLTGHGQGHARLWSEATATLARAGAARRPRFDGIARAGRLATLCDVTPGSALLAPDGNRLHPQADPLAGGCAAVWPRDSGWHRIGEGDTAPMLYVHASDALPGLAARARRDATLRLARTATPDASEAAAEGNATSTADAGPRWPWFLAWLLAAAALWWLERAARRSEAATLPPDRSRRAGP